MSDTAAGLMEPMCYRVEAEQYLIHILEKMRLRKVYGVREIQTFSAAAARYLMEHKDQPSSRVTAIYLGQLDDYIGHFPLTHIDDEALTPFIRDRKADSVLPDGTIKTGVSNRMINISIERVIHVLSLACRKWRDEERRPWLDSIAAYKARGEESEPKATPHDLGGSNRFFSEN